MSEATESRGHAAPLSGIEVVEMAGGVAGAWCGRLLADLGAAVTRVEPASGDPLRRRRELPEAPETEGLIHAWLNGGKTIAASPEHDGRSADLLILGEDFDGPPPAIALRHGTVRLSWFGTAGPYANWRGADIAIQALSGAIYPAGPMEGPPRQLGDLQSALVGGATAVSAALTLLLADRKPMAFEVSILEAAMVLGELQAADVRFLNRPTPRLGINRFSPTCPLSIHRCKEGWLGLTLLTPAQWHGFCALIDRPDLAQDPDLATIHLRALRAGELEAEIDAALLARTSGEWARLGRDMRIPIVDVPDAAAILEHPVFRVRGSLAPVRAACGTLLAPASPIRACAPGDGVPGDGMSSRATPETAGEAPLDGIRIADFSMGWAGPLATRMLSDLGAEVIKIEAGRYPDWWRATQWTPEAIAGKQYETSRRFAALNRGKKSVSFDLTTPQGLALARKLAALSDAVIENHASGVIDRLGLGWQDLSRERDDLVMVSMSAFGAGNVWSDTRAYGSTLEQAAGMPRFRGEEGEPPVMGHIAYGDPVGGLYGAAALLAGLYHRRRTGHGQWMNLSQVECLLPFTANAVLARGATGKEPPRIGNRHTHMVPHGIYRAAGEDCWIAVAAETDSAFAALAELLGRREWLGEEYGTVEARRRHEPEIDAALAEWVSSRDAASAARDLQDAGIVAAPVLSPEDAMTDPHLEARGFFHDTERPHIGHQRQCALAMLVDGRRMPLRGVAPLLGADTSAVMTGLLGESDESFYDAVSSGVVSLEPTSLRGAG